MTRWKASSTHLGISALVGAIVVALMLLYWYPPPYFEAMGGNMLVLLIIGCDVVIGPLITLIIFKSGKKGLKTDLAIIACVQLAALSYGVYTMFIARPVFTVFAVDRFEVVAAADISSEELAKAVRPEFRSLSMTGPRIVAAMVPSNPEEQMRIAMEAIRGGNDIKNLPRLYVPYEDVAQEAGRRAKPLELLLRKTAGARAIIEAIPGAEPGSHASLGFLPVAAREKSMSVIVEKSTGRIQQIVDISPW